VCECRATTTPSSNHLPQNNHASRWCSTQRGTMGQTQETLHRRCAKAFLCCDRAIFFCVCQALLPILTPTPTHLALLPILTPTHTHLAHTQHTRQSSSPSHPHPNTHPPCSHTTHTSVKLSSPSSPQHTPTLLTHNTHARITHTRTACNPETRSCTTTAAARPQGCTCTFMPHSPPLPPDYGHTNHHSLLHCVATAAVTPPLTSPLCSYSSCNSTTRISAPTHGLFALCASEVAKSPPTPAQSGPSGVTSLTTLHGMHRSSTFP
jgi:hypothetical protein